MYILMEIVKMARLSETSCRFCLKTIIDTNFEVIDDFTKDVFNVLLKLKFDHESNQLMCDICSEKLRAALQFKSMCLNAEYNIIPYVNSEGIVDLREVYMKQCESKQLVDLSHEQKVCRLCMQLLISNFRCMSKLVVNAIQTLVPEIKISITKNPVICMPCFDSLSAHNSFLKGCLEVAEIIENIANSRAEESETAPFIKTEDLQNICESTVKEDETTSLIKSETLDKEYEITEHDIESVIKSECIDIKVEDEDEKDTRLCRVKEEVAMNNGDHEYVGKTGDVQVVQDLLEHESRPQKYELDMITGQESNEGKQEENMLPYSCTMEVKMYKCDSCDFESKYKDFKNHQLRHKNCSDVKWYKCDVCNFESRYKRNYLRHQWAHGGNPSKNVQMYQCETCGYETKYKTHLAAHSVKHKDPSEVRMYKCELCDFESKYKSSFRHHKLKHKNSSDVKMYKCEVCTYRTRYKTRLKRHTMKHESISEVQM